MIPGSYENDLERDNTPLLISVIDENVTKTQENQCYLTKNIRYIFDDDEDDEEEEEEEEEGQFEQDGHHTNNLVDGKKKSSHTNDNVIVIDVDHDFQLQNIDLISNDYELLQASTTSIHPTRHTTSLSDPQSLSQKVESKDIELRVLSKFHIDSRITETNSLNDLISIYKQQNQQLQSLLQSMP